MIDAHVHFWRYSARDHAWIGPAESALRRDFLPDDLAPSLRSSGVSGCVAVQAAQSLLETEFLLDLADRHAFIESVVGWVDLTAPDLPRVLERFARRPKFSGVRHFVQDEPDPEFLLRDDVLRGLRELGHFDLTFEFLVRPAQLPAATRVARMLPELHFVLDHLGKPDVSRHAREPWTSLVRELASCPNVTAKVSGLVTEAGRGWKREDFAYYVDEALSAFGRERLVIGSDWPVCTLVSDYAEVLELARRLMGD
ncbi:MAG: amidohydrolase family protein [Planctomycetota bacterium]|nr:amidohydrolase family protein [Planctomycetota bacterium]